MYCSIKISIVVRTTVQPSSKNGKKPCRLFPTRVLSPISSNTRRNPARNDARNGHVFGMKRFGDSAPTFSFPPTYLEEDVEGCVSTNTVIARCHCGPRNKM